MPADGSTTRPSAKPGAPATVQSMAQSMAKCGIVIIGHGNTATALLEAARAIVCSHGCDQHDQHDADRGDGLAEVIALDAGVGQTPEFSAELCATIERIDEGRGVLLLADLMGSSPCMCGINQSTGHGIAVVSGLNLAMLTKLAMADHRSSPRELAEACADSAQRSVRVKVRDTQPGCT